MKKISKASGGNKMSILEVKNVSKSFGGVQANVDISVACRTRINCWSNRA